MTLVIAWTNREYAIVASDRRLTRSDGTVFDDHRTKSVVFRSRVLLGYTGPAEMEGEDTATWIAEVIAPFEQFVPALHALADRASAAVKRYRSFGGFAIVSTGWARHDGVGPPKGFIAVVTNAIDGQGRWRATPLDRAEVSFWWLGDGAPYLMRSVGQPLRQDEVHEIDRLTRAELKEDHAPGGVARVISSVVHSVADNQGDSRSALVGGGSITACLSKKAVLEGSRMFLSGIGPGFHGSVYLDANGEITRWHAPVMASGGGVYTNIGGGNVDHDHPTFGTER